MNRAKRCENKGQQSTVSEHVCLQKHEHLLVKKGISACQDCNICKYYSGLALFMKKLTLYYENNWENYNYSYFNVFTPALSDAILEAYKCLTIGAN